MNPLDFFLWGFIKEKVYATPPLDVEDCKAKITVACNELRNNPNVFARIRDSVYQRLQTCVAGGHFDFRARAVMRDFSTGWTLI